MLRFIRRSLSATIALVGFSTGGTAQPGEPVDMDALVIKEIARGADLREPLTVLHYLYFPRKENAASATEQLQDRGFSVEQRLGALGNNWLVLESHKVIVTEALIASLRADMEKLTTDFSGEYDGWEAELRPSGAP